jgi:hypothetical protein
MSTVPTLIFCHGEYSYPKAVANDPDGVVSIVNFNAIPAVRGESQRCVGLVVRLRAFAVVEKDNASAQT